MLLHRLLGPGLVFELFGRVFSGRAEGADAALVQDLGLAQDVRHALPLDPAPGAMVIGWALKLATVSLTVNRYWASMAMRRVKRRPAPLSQVRVTGVVGVRVAPSVRRQGVFGPGTPPGTFGPFQPNWA
jgi:hypothetical protein